MSGGHFDYGCFRISQFADELGREIRMNNTPKEDQLGYCPNFDDDTIRLLKECHRIIEIAGNLAKEVEWLYSGDTSEDTFIEYTSKMVATIK